MIDLNTIYISSDEEDNNERHEARNFQNGYHDEDEIGEIVFQDSPQYDDDPPPQPNDPKNFSHCSVDILLGDSQNEQHYYDDTNYDDYNDEPDDILLHPAPTKDSDNEFQSNDQHHIEKLENHNKNEEEEEIILELTDSEDETDDELLGNTTYSNYNHPRHQQQHTSSNPFASKHLEIQKGLDAMMQDQHENHYHASRKRALSPTSSHDRDTKRARVDSTLPSYLDIPFSHSSARFSSTPSISVPSLASTMGSRSIKRSSKLMKSRAKSSSIGTSSNILQKIKETDIMGGVPIPKVPLEDREERKKMRELELRRQAENQQPQSAVVRRVVHHASHIPAVEDRTELNRMRLLEQRRQAEIKSRKQRIIKFIASVYPTDKLSDIEQLKREIPHVPITFTSSEQYGNIFEPHMYMEVFAQLQRAYEEEEFPSEQATVLSTSVVDRDYMDVFFLLNVAERGDKQKDKYWYSHYDYVMLSNDRSKVFGFVVPNQSDKMKQFNVSWKNLLTIRFWKHKVSLDDIFIPKRKIKIQKISAVAPTIRAFYAIHSLDELHSNIANTLLSPSEHKVRNICDTGKNPLHDRSIKMTSAFKKYLENNFNQSQICAILNVHLKKDGFTLIQGPPGTGKTTTISGTIATLLQDREKAKTRDKLRVLFCAPSNAAVDELIIRLSKAGLIDKNADRYSPNIVRLGVRSRVNDEVVHLFIDDLVQQEIEKRKKAIDEKCKQESKKVYQELEKVRKTVDELRRSVQLMDDHNHNNCLAGKVESMRQNLSDALGKEQQLTQQLNSMESDRKKRRNEVTSQQAEIRRSFLDQADIICTTLGSVTHHELPTISFIIIDESCQCVEPDCLAPLVYNSSCKSITLVGDPQQLPATVLSKCSSNSNYTQSLMERLLNAGCEKIMLDTQYRMHPAISRFPSKAFYNNRLIDGPNCGRNGDWIYKSRGKNGNSSFSIVPYMVYDVTYSRESMGKSKSLKNDAEADYVAHLYASLIKAVDDPRKLKGKIGIISPYRQQVHEIKYHITQYCGRDALKNVQVATVDAYQGKEKDIVIFSCVRAAGDNDTTGIGFLNDVRRMNVGITRAKYAMFIACNYKQLSKNPIWRELIQDSMQHKSYQRVDHPPSGSKFVIRSDRIDSHHRAHSSSSNSSRSAAQSGSTPSSSSLHHTRHETKGTTRETRSTLLIVPPTTTQSLANGKLSKPTITAQAPIVKPAATTKFVELAVSDPRLRAVSSRNSSAVNTSSHNNNNASNNSHHHAPISKSSHGSNHHLPNTSSSSRTSSGSSSGSHHHHPRDEHRPSRPDYHNNHHHSSHQYHSDRRPSHPSSSSEHHQHHDSPRRKRHPERPNKN